MNWTKPVVHEVGAIYSSAQHSWLSEVMVVTFRYWPGDSGLESHFCQILFVEFI